MASISLKYKSKSGNLTAPGDVDPGAMIPIATATVSTAGTTVSFSNIPQNYEHLQVRIFAATARATPDDITIYGFDGTGGSANAASHILYGNGTSVFASGGTAQYNPALTQIPGTNATSNRSAVIVDILDYTNTNKYKVVRSLGGYDANGSGYIAFMSALPFGFGSSTALSNVWFYCATNFAVGSTFALYGIKRAGA